MEQIYKKGAWNDNSYLIAGVILIAISLSARIASYPVASVDYTTSIANWMHTLSVSRGLSAFMYPFADYAPLYLYALKALTLIPVKGLYAVKTLSSLFDVAVAAIACLLISRSEKRRFSATQIFFAGSLIFAIPTVVLNSSLWAQCDAVYAAFTLLSVYFIAKDKPTAAALAFGIAISIKLQAVFFLPVLVGYLLTRRRGIFRLLYIPAIFAISIVPAWFYGGPFGSWFAIYAHQSAEFPQLSLSAPTIFSFVNAGALGHGFQNFLSFAGIAASAVAAMLVAALVFSSVRQKGRFDPEKLVLLSLLSVVIVPFLLPHMHERYFYLADILSVVYAFYTPRHWYVPVAVVLSSLYSYFPFLSASVHAMGNYIVPESLPGFVMLLVAAFLVGKATRLNRTMDPL